MQEVAGIFAGLDPALWLLTCAAGSQRGGLIATFVSPASIIVEQPRVVVGLARQHHTWQLVEASGAFVLQLLDETQLDWVWHFGLQSGRDRDKLADLVTVPCPGGQPRLALTLAWLECRVETTFDLGDRSLYLAAVSAGRRERPGTPLTLQRLLQLAPPDRRAEMKAQRERDAAIDARLRLSRQH